MFLRGGPKIASTDLDFTTMISSGMTIAGMLMGTDSATFIKSDYLPSAVIIFWSVHFHSMFSSLATSSLIMQISDPPFITIGGTGLSTFPRMIGEALGYSNSKYQTYSFRLEMAQLCGILICSSADVVLAVTHLYLGTQTLLAFGSS